MMKFVTYLRTDDSNKPVRMFVYDDEKQAQEYVNNMLDTKKHPNVADCFYKEENA